MASLQELQANFNAAFDVLPVGQSIPGWWHHLQHGRRAGVLRRAERLSSSDQRARRGAACRVKPYIAQQWAGEGYDLAPAQTFSTRPEQVMQAPEPVSVAAPPGGSPQAHRSSMRRGNTCQRPRIRQGLPALTKTRRPGSTYLLDTSRAMTPMGAMWSVPVGWYEADGQNVGDMMRAYDMNGNADAANNVAIKTPAIPFGQAHQGRDSGGVGAGLGNIAGIGERRLARAIPSCTGAGFRVGAVLGDATMPGPFRVSAPTRRRLRWSALAVGTGDAFLPGL